MVLNELAQWFLQVDGIDISAYDDAFLKSVLNKRLEATGCHSLHEWEELATSAPQERVAFLALLENTYSTFFRSPLAFSLLEEYLLPRLMKRNLASAELRIWSAGCAAGQEAYSIAILLERLTTLCGVGGHYRVFATDRSPEGLQMAREGLFEAGDLQNIRLRDLNDYFLPEGQKYRISPAIRQRVDFSVYNLLDPNSISPPVSIYGDFDVVICSNVMLYYRPGVRSQILDKLLRAIAPNGYLLVGEAEKGIVQADGRFRLTIPQAPVFEPIQAGTL